MLTVFRRTRGGQLLDAQLGLVTTDTGDCWRIIPATKPGRVEIASADSGGLGDVAATVHAPAEALLLADWGRQPIDGASFRVTGRPELAPAFLPGPA